MVKSSEPYRLPGLDDRFLLGAARAEQGSSVLRRHVNHLLEVAGLVERQQGSVPDFPGLLPRATTESGRHEEKRVVRDAGVDVDTTGVGRSRVFVLQMFRLRIGAQI